MFETRVGYNACANLFQSDNFVHGRRALYTVTADLYDMPDSDHFTLGQDHAWDIAGRIRGGD